jgi:hypothetical protein
MAVVLQHPKRGAATPPEQAARHAAIVLTALAAGALLQIGESLAWKMAAEGVIPTLNLGRRKVVPAKAVQMSSNSTVPPASRAVQKESASNVGAHTLLSTSV